MGRSVIFRRLLAVCLAACLLLSGCSGIDLKGYWDNLLGVLSGAPAFSDMEYTRPDMDAMQKKLDDLCALAANATDVEELTDGIWDFYELYDGFSTAYALSMIHYYEDLTDSYWAQEHQFCVENEATANAALDSLYRALAASPLRAQLEDEAYFGAGYFDYYETDSQYDETTLALLEQEAQLLNRYYDVSAESGSMDTYSDAYFTRYGTRMAQVYVELIAVRQQLAQHLGYSDYTTFAYDFYYYRDYTPAQATEYLDQIQQELTPLYVQHLQSDFWDRGTAYSNESKTFAYVSSMAEAMGGTIEEAFSTLKRNGLYSIHPGANKYKASFEVYLPGYYQPFVFLNPAGSTFDHLTFAHEFGHFCSDYVSYGSVAGVDVAEIFSQGMEYLSLFYADGGSDLTALKLSDCLCLYVEQAALASFEQQVYRLQGEDLTVENVEKLYSSVCHAYGLDSTGWDSRGYVNITHYFSNPMYIISYVVSNDAALQLYQLEQSQSGAGLAALESNLATTQAYFLAFLEEAGLTSPFAEGRLAAVKQLMAEKLLPNRA